MFSLPRKQQVCLIGGTGRYAISSVLKRGISQTDCRLARDGTFYDRVLLALRSPFAVLHRKDLMRIESLGRKRPPLFGKGDAAFYDLAEAMVYNISDEDASFMSAEDLSEKGYLNTFNHVSAQAFMTSIFSESVADFVADVHERDHSPDLINKDFTEAQINDLSEGPVDNYLDMLNNEWGQELGKALRKKYKINRHTHWTPELLADYLNDNQSYYSSVFHIAFKPFRETDELVIQFAIKINRVMTALPKFKTRR